MLAEQFVSSATTMENGAGDYTARLEWPDKPSSWEWENVVMLSRKPAAADWCDEPPLLVSSNSSTQDIKPIQQHQQQHHHQQVVSPAATAMLPPRSATAEAKKASSAATATNQVCSSVTTNSKEFLLGLAPTVPEGAKTVNSSQLDAETGLKLGLKRTFTPETPSSKPASSPGKRSRGSAHHTPRCQVEGCRTDLSSAKDYHRRHKVCAMHSKSAKVSVNSIEQRFCQQCSRFHVLTEFDEGKRSCRRRLAGHNERRRKPQPDPMQLTTALAPYQAGFMRLTRDDRIFGYGTPLSYLGLDNLHSGKLTWPRLGSVDVVDHTTGVVGSTSNFSSSRGPERFFMLFPQRKGPILNGFVGHQFIQGSGNCSGGSMMGQNLTLSSASQLGAPNQQASNGVTAADSGRALSLLSSQSWAAAHDSMSQVLMENGTKRYHSSNQNFATGVGSGGSPSGGRGYGPSTAQQAVVSLEGQGSYLNNYENNSVLTLLQENDYQPPPPSRPTTIDLMMQMSTQQQQQQATQPPNDSFQVVKPSLYHGSSSASIYDHPHHL